MRMNSNIFVQPIMHKLMSSPITKVMTNLKFSLFLVFIFITNNIKLKNTKNNIKIYGSLLFVNSTSAPSQQIHSLPSK